MAEDCNGCAVCLLSCPVWAQTHDQTLTFSGRMRSMQGGAVLSDLASSVNNCVLCGSCEPVCSYGVESVMRTLEMRAALRDEHAPPYVQQQETASRASGRVLLPNHLILNNTGILDNTLAHLGGGVTVHADTGDDLSEAMVKGMRVDSSRLESFIDSLRRASEVITTDSIVFRLLRRLSPGTTIRSLGEVLLGVPAFRASMGPDDLYVIDAGTYNADYARMVAFYDTVRRTTGAKMNLDLHRVATPTGVQLHSTSPGIDPVKQARWILEGRSVKRIIVERLEDIETFRAVTNAPVIFVAELA